MKFPNPEIEPLLSKVDTVPGVFVVIEGPDASGKTTVIQEVARILREKAPVHVTQEPFFPSSRQWLNEGHTTVANAFTMLGDRFDHLIRDVFPNLLNGKIVLCSRYSASTLVYNVLRMRDLKALQQHLLSTWRFIPMPHLQYIILADQEELKNRLVRRSSEGTLVEDSDFPEEFVDYLVSAYQTLVPRYEPVEEVFWSDSVNAADIAKKIAHQVHQKWMSNVNRFSKQLREAAGRVG